MDLLLKILRGLIVVGVAGYALLLLGCVSFQRKMLYFGAEDDTVIPVRRAEALAKSVPQAKWHLLSGGHNDWSRQPMEIRYRKARCRALRTTLECGKIQPDLRQKSLSG